jgi:hypothetical protein
MLAVHVRMDPSDAMFVLAIWSLRATAISSALLLVAHVVTEVLAEGGGLNADTLWGADKGTDKCLWIAVFLLVLSAWLPKKIAKGVEIRNSG